MLNKERDRQQHTTGHGASSPSRPGSPGSPFSPLKPRKPCSWNQSYKHPIVQPHPHTRSSVPAPDWPKCTGRDWQEQAYWGWELHIVQRDIKYKLCIELESPPYCVQLNHIPVSQNPEKKNPVRVLVPSVFFQNIVSVYGIIRARTGTRTALGIG